MAAGFRSPLLPLGFSAPAPVTQPGHRSLFAFWIGGACAPAPVTSAGYRSLLAFWAGGASSIEGVEPPEPPVVIPGGGPDHFPPPRRREPAPARIIEGYMLAREAPDGFRATGDVYESEANVKARRNARALRILLLNS